MHILVICDDCWHPASVIKNGLKPLTYNGFEFSYVGNMVD